jgi:hypothetical protein
MLVIDVIESEIICKPSTKDRRTYWAERRRWWASHKAETGTDWAGIQRSLVEAAAYLAYLRNRAASHLSPEAIVEQPESNTDFQGEYDDLSSTFASACRKADAERRNPHLRARGDSLPTSMCITLDWLLRYCEEQRLEKFIEGRPAAEIARIHDYIGMKLNGSHS